MASLPLSQARSMAQRQRRQAAQQQDLIASLPEDLLIEILRRLGCASTAARAGLVSGGWRGLWTQLREICLIGVGPGSSSHALARLRAAVISGVRAARLDVLHVEPFIRGASPRRAASLLRRAARLAPVELKLSLFSKQPFARERVRLPCFGSTKSIDLRLQDFRLAPPQGDNLFLGLERLALKGCVFDPAALLPRCPRLRVLQIEAELAATTDVISLPLLEELVVAESFQASRLHVGAPVLKRLSLSNHIEDVSISAPDLEKLSLDCAKNMNRLELGNMPQLRELVLVGIHRLAFNDRLRVGNGVDHFLQQLPRLRLLRISMSMAPRLPRNLPHDWLETLPRTSVLMLELKTDGHVFAATVLHLLEKVKGIEELTVLFDPPKLGGECSQDCSCHHNRDLSIEDFSLPILRKVEFNGFNGAHCAFHVLGNLLSAAEMLEQVTVTLRDEDPSNETLKHQLLDIFTSYPTVTYHVVNA